MQIKKQTFKPSAFEKRVKRRVSGREHTFFAACPPGLGRLCKNELTALADRLAPFLPSPPKIRDITSLPGGIEFTTRLEIACLANLFLGTPVRILMRLARFKADSFFQLEKQIKAVDWELFLPQGCDLDIRVTTHKSRLYHSDAVADRCRPLILSRLHPTDISPAATLPQTLMVRADNDRFEISIDMSGTPLFKRGIKQKVIQAPLRENLAFAVLTRLNLAAQDILVDPMCGSGTFCLEAAMIQTGLPPVFFRQFALEAWPGFKEKTFAHAREKIEEKFQEKAGNKPPTLFASDTDPEAVDNLTASCRVHPAFDRISTACADFFEMSPPKTDSGLVVLNPPYGLRLGKDLDIERLYKEIGKKLSADFKGWRTGIIYPEKRLGNALNLRLSPMPLFHGGIDLFVGLGKID